jgi:hypothetical protein
LESQEEGGTKEMSDVLYYFYKRAIRWIRKEPLYNVCIISGALMGIIIAFLIKLAR